MGNIETKNDSPNVTTKPTETDDNEVVFGSYNDPENPRPGYYIHKTKRKVFYRGKPMTEVDFDTFKKLRQGYAEDKNNRYYKGSTVKSNKD
jgi:hypothetical protein